MISVTLCSLNANGNCVAVQSCPMRFAAPPLMKREDRDHGAVDSATAEQSIPRPRSGGFGDFGADNSATAERSM